MGSKNHQCLPCQRDENVCRDSCAGADRPRMKRGIVRDGIGAALSSAAILCAKSVCVSVSWVVATRLQHTRRPWNGALGKDVTLCSAALPAREFGPGIAQADGAVEHRAGPALIGVDAEIAWRSNCTGTPGAAVASAGSRRASASTSSESGLRSATNAAAFGSGRANSGL